ncbi:hypothetical protein DFH06DRAFT_981023 [Mycena polygramma]|nr:hypothetical protein DFH06DRAFT_981023 [Mycena polygramma]
MVFPTLPIELHEEIIGYLHGDVPTLKSCSLVCQAWRLSTRTRLFYRFNAWHDAFADDGSLWEVRPGGFSSRGLYPRNRYSRWNGRSTDRTGGTRALRHFGPYTHSPEAFYLDISRTLGYYAALEGGFAAIQAFALSSPA